jgi:hypothetical protein
MAEYVAKDLLRASDMSLLEIQAFDWTKQQKGNDRGTPLAPILIVLPERLAVLDKTSLSTLNNPPLVTRAANYSQLGSV